jgi:hypothetical protein
VRKIRHFKTASFNYDDDDDDDDNLLGLSLFAVSEANYILTLGYRGIYFPFYIFKLRIFYFIKPFNFNYG